MEIYFSVKSLDEVIGYWVETYYMYSRLMELSEYSDEVGENYDFPSWLENNDAPKMSIMNLHEKIENAEDSAHDFVKTSEARLKAVLLSGLENNDKALMDIPISCIDWNKEIDHLIEYLYQSFDDMIYDYETTKQIENFYNTVREYVNNIIS